MTDANATDRDLASWRIPLFPARLPRHKKLWAEGSDRGAEFIADMQQQSGLELDIVDRVPTVTGFKRLPTRWRVERTLAWLSG